MTFAALLPFFRLTLALHVISVILWMAGMLTLPWLYAEHARTAPGAPELRRFEEMERKLLRLAINPAMVLAWTFGILLILTPGAISWHAGWWQTKFASVIFLSVYHGELSRWRRVFRDGRNRWSAGVYRAAAILPPLLIVLIVVMVIMQPF